MGNERLVNGKTHAQIVVEYTTLGLGVLGLKWDVARRIATEIADEKFGRPVLSDQVRQPGQAETWLQGRNAHVDC